MVKPDRILLAIAILVLFPYAAIAGSMQHSTSLVQTSALDNDLKRFCSAQWPSDFRMQEFCVNQQQTSVNHVAEYHKRHRVQSMPHTPHSQIFTRCLDKGETPHGTDFKIVDLCIREEAEAFDSLGGK